SVVPEFHAPLANDNLAASFAEVSPQVTAASPSREGELAGLSSDGRLTDAKPDFRLGPLSNSGDPATHTPLTGATPETRLDSQLGDSHHADFDSQFWASFAIPEARLYSQLWS